VRRLRVRVDGIVKSTSWLETVLFTTRNGLSTSIVKYHIIAPMQRMGLYLMSNVCGETNSSYESLSIETNNGNGNATACTNENTLLLHHRHWPAKKGLHEMSLEGVSIRPSPLRKSPTISLT